MTREAVTERVRAWATNLPRATRDRPDLSSWALLADLTLAAVLAVGTGLYAWRDRVGEDAAVMVLPHAPTAPDAPFAPFATPVPLPGVKLPVDIVTQMDAGTHWALAVGAALTAAPLLVRRRYPLAAFCSVVVAILVFHLCADSPVAAEALSLTCLIAGYSAARYSPYRTGALTAVVVGALLIAPVTFRGILTIKGVYVPFLVLVPLGLAANAIHTWKQRALGLEAGQEATTRLAVERERSRIARELHDVVTHNVSVMVVQAGAARKVIDVAPDAAREALLAVEAGGRAAMAELRHVMGLLTLATDGMATDGMATDGPDAAGGGDLAPQPGLGQVEALAGRVRDTGVPVRLTLAGQPRPLPPGVDLAAYRVVQEALTNTVKHAAGASVAITIGYTDDAVSVEVTDTGGLATAPADAGSGRGLIGLRERLAVYGGTLRAEKADTGGYQVRAVIPLGPA
ncbi:sensor histidine kinase [Pseudofrankia inefficax]|uniref:histidine kinase n=1 Tax=Pseudofrankia inefficax (strain DSM 45817 / CECT 9037 / DDB 130130 / EuI1c) TaxID=298654 RepID=E3J1B7_PSEI1|nr:sensor histidine kinase [Pseudofrankia inefficax]ADP80438.1 integral membrane sensor signal transduction histidine kinase [Pseudofrankia inefficax]